MIVKKDKKLENRVDSLINTLERREIITRNHSKENALVIASYLSIKQLEYIIGRRDGKEFLDLIVDASKEELLDRQILKVKKKSLEIHAEDDRRF